MTRSSIIFLAAIATVAAATFAGFLVGKRVERGQCDAELLAQIEIGQKLDAARRTMERKRDDLARKLTEEAYEDPVAVVQCLGPDRVRRLNALR